jgi:hypothetical protein
MRILITGSRNWSDVDKIREAIMDALPGIPYGDPARHTVVHGGARGADYIAAEIAHQLGLTVEEHPADWEDHGKAAGPIRNQKMVNLGADICLAFPLGYSRGSWDCMFRAAMAGIPIENHGHPTPGLVVTG